MLIRPATEEDHDTIWQILEPTIRAGETYALPRDMSREDALAYWTGAAAKRSLPIETDRPSAPTISVPISLAEVRT